jgi:hypothetical protein
MTIRAFFTNLGKLLLCSLAFILGAIAGGIILIACSSPASLQQADEAAIYAAVIRRIYTQDDTFGGTFQAPTVYVLQTTDDSVGDPGIDQSEPRTLTDIVQREINTSLADMSMNIVWIRDSSEVPLDPRTGASNDGGVIISLGNIHLQRGGTVHVSGSIYISQLAAGGQTYILEQTNGVWEVTGNTGVVWVS